MFANFVTLFILFHVAGGGKVVNEVVHCQPVTSCSNRCNIEKNSGQYYDPGVGAYVFPSYNCFCDPLCRLYGDCCHDYENICANSSKNLKDFQTQVDKVNHGESHQQLEKVDYQLNEPSHKKIRSMFECITIEEYPHRPFWTTNKCQPSWLNSDVSKRCSNITEADLLSRLPVLSDDGLTYRNVFCAQCNGRTTATFWNTEARCQNVPPDNATVDPNALALYLKDCVTFFTTKSAPPRYCLRVEDTCDHSKLDATKNFTKLSRACFENYQYPVIYNQNGGSTQIFKNSFCAECNGIDISREYCPSSRNKEIANVDEYRYFLNEKLDYKYSVITDFNTRDSNHVVIMDHSSGNVVPVVIECPDGKVYDPYAEVCREIYCGQSYMLVGDECVEDSRPSEYFPMISNNTIKTNVTEITFRLTIVVRFEITSDNLNQTFKELNNFQLLKDSLNMSRINITLYNDTVHIVGEIFKNFSTNSTTLQITKANVTISGKAIVHLTTAAREYIDIAKNLTTIISSLAHSVDIYDVTIYVDSTEIELPNTDQNVVPNIEVSNINQFNTFLHECQTGVIRVYRVVDVTYIPQDGCVSVFVNSSETEYSCTESYIYSNENINNTSQKNDAVFVCDQVYKMDDSCRRIHYNNTSYTITDDGSVHLEDGSIYEKGDYIKVGDDQIEVCTEFDKVQEVYYVIFFDFNDVQKCIAFMCISISMSGLTLTIVTYSLIAELRTLPGQCIICLASTTLAGQLIFVFGINTDNAIMCTTFAILLHYFFLSSFLWTNVMAYDLYKTFGDIFTMIVVAFHITEFYSFTWPFLWRHDVQCIIHRYCRYLCFHGTVFTLTAIAVDRYVAVCDVMRYKLKFTQRRTNRIIVLVWILAIFASAPAVLMFQSKYEAGKDEYADVKYAGQIPFACKVVYPSNLPWFSTFKAFYFNIFLFFVPVIIIAILNIKIVLFMRRYVRESIIDSRSTNNLYRSHTSVKLHWKMAKLLVFVSIVYLLCYLLFVLYQILSKYAEMPTNLKNLAIVLPYANSCANPVIYSLFNANFRRKFFTIIGKKFMWKRATKKSRQNTLYILNLN
ncbi:uncharacterized protein LOC117107186 [Anneissia japonica]|uniref:uncharacterized protein LOC117107186 n=1 Tax=Anneissia japonica TaxID=1529436 RepID=UPI0014258972|nr:uncharacterized protein LOC117107186 [Anneissia japonica]